MRFVKPIDGKLVCDLASTYSLLVTLEENVIAGGAGSAVNELLAAKQLLTPILNLGLPDQYIDHGSQQQQLAACGLDAKGIFKSISESVYYQPALKKQSTSV